MYYPILRGKQNELLALRELAEVNTKLVTPLIEPVNENFSPLIKTIEVLNKNGIEPLVVINPDKGEFKNNRKVLDDLINLTKISFLPCINYKDSRNSLLVKKFPRFSILADGVSDELIEHSHKSEVTFMRSDVSTDVLNNLKNVVLYDDFFKSQIKNANYPTESKFTSIHTYYKNDPNVIGFGDYTITGYEFSESGGPAYVVAIHLSYIDGTRYDEKYIKHYLSFDDKTSKKGPEKFKYALEKLIADVDRNPHHFFTGTGLAGFRDLHRRQHFPGLGQVKKFSIMHHLETFNDYLLNNV